jgi:Bacterial pre-peptidase C-terminal domain
MRVVITILLGVAALGAQPCVPSRILPVDSQAGSLDASSCKLSDGTAYAAYRLDLPVRGQIQIALNSGPASFALLLRDSSGAAIVSGSSIQRPIEAGSYNVLIHTQTAGTLGPYTVTTSFTAEPGMLCNSFPNLGLNQTVHGLLGSSGCVTPTAAPYEAYSVNTLGSGTLTISIQATGFIPLLQLRDPTEHVLASDPQTIVLPVCGDSQYQVVITAPGPALAGPAASTYQLTTSFQPAPTETCKSQQNMSSSGQDSNSITATSCTVTFPGSGDLAYYNYYILSVPASGLADIRVTTGDFIPTLVLLDSSGNTLATDSEGYDYNVNLSDSELRLQLTPGTYTVLLYSDVSSGGNYNFTYQLTPGPPQPCSPSAAPQGTSYGALSGASCRTTLGLSDLYSLKLPADGTLNFTLMSGDFVPQLAIRDAKDNLIVMDSDDSGSGIAYISADLPAGTYTVVPSAVSGIGRYQLSSDFTAHPIQTCTTASTLALNGTYYEYLGASGCRGVNGQPVDLYQFTLPADGVIASVIASSDIDGFLTLMDSAGNVLRTDDNTYGNGDPLIVQTLPAGTYQLAARAAQATPGGPYALALYVAIEPRPPFCTPRGVLPAGGSLAGNINSAGCQYPDNTLADLYRFDLAADATVDLHLNSADFDAFLILLDSSGNVVAQDDDSGGGTNARITRATKAGTYYIVAKPFSDYFSQGDYSLSVTVQ